MNRKLSQLLTQQRTDIDSLLADRKTLIILVMKRIDQENMAGRPLRPLIRESGMTPQTYYQWKRHTPTNSLGPEPEDLHILNRKLATLDQSIKDLKFQRRQTILALDYAIPANDIAQIGGITSAYVRRLRRESTQ